MENILRAKFVHVTLQKALEIRKDYENYDIGDLAKKYNYSKITIRAILQGTHPIFRKENNEKV